MTQSRTELAGLAVIRRWPSPQARDWVYRFVEWAATNSAIRVVVAIGSAVRPVHKSLDIDLLVGHVGSAPIFNAAPIDVDLRYFLVDELHQLALEGHDLVGWGVKYGEAILDKDGRWKELVREVAEEIPLPSAAASLARAERAEKILKQLIDVADEDAIHEQLLSFLTHLTRARLVRHGIYPASRPELPQQLRAVGDHRLAQALEETIHGQPSGRDVLREFGLTSKTSRTSD